MTLMFEKYEENMINLSLIGFFLEYKQIKDEGF